MLICIQIRVNQALSRGIHETVSENAEYSSKIRSNIFSFTIDGAHVIWFSVDLKLLYRHVVLCKVMLTQQRWLKNMVSCSALRSTSHTLASSRWHSSFIRQGHPFSHKSTRSGHIYQHQLQFKDQCEHLTSHDVLLYVWGSEVTLKTEQRFALKWLKVI